MDSSLRIAPNKNGIIAIYSTSNLGYLCTLTLKDPASGTLMPVARSYDGSDWEVTAGPLASTLAKPICSNGICKFDNIPESDSNEKTYILTSYFHMSLSEYADAARLLEQATFGPTRATISALADLSGADKYEKWVKDQMGKPLTSHREYYRKR